MTEILQQEVWERGDGKSQLRYVLEFVNPTGYVPNMWPLTRLKALNIMLDYLVETEGKLARFEPSDTSELLRATFARDRSRDKHSEVYPEDRCSMEQDKPMFVNAKDWSEDEIKVFSGALEILGQLSGYTAVIAGIANDFSETVLSIR